MTTYEEQIRGALQAVTVTSETSFAWFGQHSGQLPQGLVRALVLAVVTALAFWVLVMPPNLIFGTAFWPDRVLVLALAGLSFRHPAATPLFLTEVLLLAQQARFPELTLSRGSHYPVLREPAVPHLRSE